MTLALAGELRLLGDVADEIAGEPPRAELGGDDLLFRGPLLRQLESGAGVIDRGGDAELVIADAQSDEPGRRAMVDHRFDELLNAELHAQRDVAARAPNAGIAL